MDLQNTFLVSFIMSEAPTPIPSASALLGDVQTRPVWDEASISHADAEYPRVHLDWHEGHGFVFQCYEAGESWSDFLVTSRQFSTPSVEVELGGQAFERWPRELFVSAERADQALGHFLEFGKQDPPSSGSESMPCRGKSCGRTAREERPGNAQIGHRMGTFSPQVSCRPILSIVALQCREAS
jgi:hypothetical protein